MDKLGAIFATFVTALFLGGCMVYGASANNSPVEQARGDAIRIQAEADRAVQMMYANQDAADRAQARNGNNQPDWPFIAVMAFCGQTVMFIIILLFILAKTGRQNNQAQTAEIVNIEGVSYRLEPIRRIDEIQRRG